MDRIPKMKTGRKGRPSNRPVYRIMLQMLLVATMGNKRAAVGLLRTCRNYVIKRRATRSGMTDMECIHEFVNATGRRFVKASLRRLLVRKLLIKAKVNEIKARELQETMEDTADLCQEDGMPDELLCDLARRGCTDMMETLIKNGRNPNGGTNQRYTPLMAAASEDNVETVGMLLLNGADPAIEDDAGDTALVYADPATASRYLLGNSELNKD